MFRPLEGRCATLERVGDAGRSRGVSMGTLERGGDRPAGSRGMRIGRTLGFFESFPFLPDGKQAVGLRGLSRLTCVCIFQSDLSTPIRVSLIVVPNSILL